MKNTSVFLSAVLACCLAGCGGASGPRTATPVLLEDEVQVRLDSEGRPQVGASQAAGVGAVKAPE